jgi:agmatinase
MRFSLIAAGIAALVLGASPAEAAKRLALVIGNNAYENVPKLMKAVNDADAVASELSKLGFEVVTAIEVHELGMNAVAQRIRERVTGGPVFFSFDIDFVDPAYAPATGTPEIGGFTTWEVQSLIRRLAGLEYVGFDVVEVIPEYDVAQNTALVAANVAYEFLALLARARQSAP